MDTLRSIFDTVTFVFGYFGLGRETIFLVSTLIDMVAVTGLAWLVVRGGRQRDAALEEQRAALESLRTDLAELLADAEQRAHALEEALGAREQSLRGLLGDVGRAEEKRPAPKRASVQAARPRATAAPAEPRSKPAGIEALRGDLAQVARKLNVDPAEARLLRDLEVSLGGKEA